MTALKVLSLRQPYASLVMAGVKRFETRPGPPNGDMRPEGVRAGVGGCAVNRGDIIGIASTQQVAVEHGDWVGQWNVCRKPYGWTMYGPPTYDLYESGEVPLPRGALLGTVRVVDAYPIIGHSDDLVGRPAHVLSGTKYDPERLNLYRPGVGISNTGTGTPSVEHFEWDLTVLADQRPYGDWEPGRWAIELANPTPTTAGCPECDNDPVYRDDAWIAEGGGPCWLCDGVGRPDPVPVSGLQGVWRLTPERLREQVPA